MIYEEKVQKTTFLKPCLKGIEDFTKNGKESLKKLIKNLSMQNGVRVCSQNLEMLLKFGKQINIFWIGTWFAWLQSQLFSFKHTEVAYHLGPCRHFEPLSGYEDKAPIEVTPEIKAHVVEFMTTFALELIDDEYEKRSSRMGFVFVLLSMRNEDKATMLEVESWSIQKHEAKEWLTYGGLTGHETPFLDYLAEKEEKDKTELSKKILAKAESFQDKLSSMLVDMHKLKRKFKSASTIWDLNILYEDYLGVLMPSNQAVELERTVSEDDWTRKPEYEVNANEYNF